MESTARAERFNSEASKFPSYTWHVPNKPVSVRIPLELMDKLEREAVESFRSLTSRGSEIGGILMGTVKAGTPALVTITSYELIPCDYSRGPLYRLSQADLEKFTAARQRAGSGGTAVVGFFRSHTRKGLSLDADDLKLFETHFGEPHAIALVVRPFATKASLAGIFIREGNAIHSEASYLEFPFRSSELPSDAPPEIADTPLPAPTVPKIAPRAQVVPIESRREIAPVPPPPRVEEPASVVPSPEIVAADPLPPVKPAETAEPAAPVRAEAAVPAPPPAAEKSVPPAPEPEPGLKTGFDSAESAEPASGRKGKLLWFVLAGAATLLLSGTLFVYPGVLRHSSRPTPAVNQDTSALSLRVEPSAGQLLLTWNRESDAIRNASRAVLSISDGGQHENVEMDLGQLRNGSIIYSPVTADVVFMMEVTGKDQGKTTSESVRVLRTRPSPMPTDNPAQANAATPPPPVAQTAPPASAEPAAEEPAPVHEAPAPRARPVKPFNAESLSQRLRAATSTDVPDVPIAARGGTVSAPSIAGLNLGAAAAPAPPPTAPAGSSPAPAARKAGGAPQIQPAQLIRRKDPEYPKIARDAGAKGVVELSATIGTDGRVKKVRVVRGHAMLVRAAQDAVMQWVYRPTLLNGSPVEADTQILLDFRPGQ